MADDLRQFRRTRFPWRITIAIACFACVVILRYSFPPGSTMLDVTHLPIQSGVHGLLGITDSGCLEVGVSEHLQHPEAVPVRLLGVKIEQRSAAVAHLRSSLASVEEIRLRFDRRRVAPNGTELLAYAFRGETCLNIELVRLGLASDDTHPADSGPMIRQIKKAEQAAKLEQLGVWSN